jgi:hypothetical protein
MASPKTPPTPDQLARSISVLVAAYVDGARRSAHEALDEAFSVALALNGRAVQKRRSTPSRGAAAPSRRRSADEISELEERLLALVCASPGESMTVFSEELGQSVPSLQRPMSKLRADGRVRCVGERNMARYFPAVGRRSTS